MSVSTTVTNEAGTDQQSSVDTGFSVIIKILLSKWWIFLIIAVLAGLGGILYASKQPVRYKSKLTFALDDGGGGSMGGFAGLASQLGLAVSSGKEIFSGDNILSILKSRRMVEKVLLSVDTFENKPYRLIQYYLEITKSKSNVNYPVTQTRDRFSYAQDSILKKTFSDLVEKEISAEKPDKKLNIYELKVSSLNEKFTKIFTDKLIEETKLFYTEIRTKKAWETLQVLENRVSSIKGNLNASISTRAAVQDANLNPALASTQVGATKQQVNIQAYGAAYNELFKNLELARFQYLNEVPLMQIIDTADYPMEKTKMSKLITGIKFSVIACLLLFFIFWVRTLRPSVVNMVNNSQK